MASFLDKISLFSSLTKEEKDNLALFCQEKNLEVGEIVFLEGDDANSMYILATGKIEVYKYVNGEEIILGYIKAEEILGEMALFGGTGCRTASARAIENTILITILSFSIQEIVDKHPDLLEKIKNIMISRQEKNNKINY